MRQTTWTPVYFIAQLFYFIALVRTALAPLVMQGHNLYHLISSDYRERKSTTAKVTVVIGARGRYSPVKKITAALSWSSQDVAFRFWPYCLSQSIHALLEISDICRLHGICSQ